MYLQRPHDNFRSDVSVAVRAVDRHPLIRRLDGDGPEVVQPGRRLRHRSRVDPDVVGVGIGLVPSH